MSFRILENNELYKRIQQKNTFRAFSKGCNRSLMARNQENIQPLHRTVEQTISIPSQTITSLKTNSLLAYKLQNNYMKSFRNQLEGTKLEEIPENHLPNVTLKKLWACSRTEPAQLDLTGQSKLRNITQNTHCFAHSIRNSDTDLQYSNFRRNSENFKLKSCVSRGKIDYDGPSDESDFSTLDIRKKSQILSSTKEKTQHTQRQNLKIFNRSKTKDIMSLLHLSESKNHKQFIISKYSKLVRQGLKQRMKNSLK